MFLKILSVEVHLSWSRNPINFDRNIQNRKLNMKMNKRKYHLFFLAVLNAKIYRNLISSSS